MNRRQRKQSFKLGLETLENRRLMAADIDYQSSTKTLFVKGDNFVDTVQVRFNGNDVKVDLYSTRSNGSTYHEDRTKRIADVARILVQGLAGNDTLNIIQGTLNSGVTLNNTAIEFAGDQGNDAMDNQTAVRTTAYGGDGNDVFRGGASTDRLFGDAGNDTLEGRGGDDLLRGGINNDTLFGGDGQDQVYGEDGDDWMSGQAGGDYLYGGLGNDTIYGGADNDNIYGDAGNDFLSGDDGRDLIWGSLGNDTMLGGNDNDVMQGEQDDDLMYGGAGNDVMTGGTGNDNMMGDSGQDQLYGNDGNDSLEGGYDGALDYLVGGNGIDTFWSKYTRKFGFFEITFESDWVGDFSLSDIQKKRSV